MVFSVGLLLRLCEVCYISQIMCFGIYGFALFVVCYFFLLQMSSFMVLSIQDFLFILFYLVRCIVSC